MYPACMSFGSGQSPCLLFLGEGKLPGGRMEWLCRSIATTDLASLQALHWKPRSEPHSVRLSTVPLLCSFCLQFHTYSRRRARDSIIHSRRHQQDGLPPSHGLKLEGAGKMQASIRTCQSAFGVGRRLLDGSHSLASSANNRGVRYRPSHVLPHLTTAAPEPPHQEEVQKDLQEWVSLATSLYPVYMLAGGLLAFLRPSTFSWFVKRGPNSYSAALGLIMLAMGLTLRIQDLLHVVLNRPLAVLFGFAAQYGIMPLVGAGVSRALGLSPEFSAGLILMSCCPGGTASNVVTYIAGGDVPLSILMTMCTTLAAVVTTPLLTRALAGSYVPVDAAGLALSTLQVVLAPTLLGACMQSSCPQIVASITQFAPLVAVLVSSLLASSVFSANVPLLGAASLTSHIGTIPGTLLSTSTAGAVFMSPAQSASSVLAHLGIIGGAVLSVHAAGFFLGYVVAMLAGFAESQRRAISIEVGMQNSSLGVVLATTHFTSPLTAVPAAVSAVLMNIMGSGLAVVWRQIGITSEDAGAGKVPLAESVKQNNSS